MIKRGKQGAQSNPSQLCGPQYNSSWGLYKVPLDYSSNCKQVVVLASVQAGSRQDSGSSQQTHSHQRFGKALGFVHSPVKVCYLVKGLAARGDLFHWYSWAPVTVQAMHSIYT